MELLTFRWDPRAAWSVPELPELDSPETLVLVFGGAALADDPAPLRELAARFPRSILAGCSSAGEIDGEHIRDDGLVVTVARFEAVRLRKATAPSTDARAAGESLARELAGGDLRMLLVLSDGLAVNGTDLLAGVHRVVGPDVVVTGGLAADGTRFARTWVLDGGAPRDGRITAVAFYGARLGVTHGSRGGWDAFGPERVVTRAEGNVLYELDGEPALALYKKYLGDRAAGLPSTALLFPLALRSASRDAPVVVRTILSVDEERQSMTFAGDIPEESVVQLMRANVDRLVDGAAGAACAAAVPCAEPSLWIGVSCVGRRIVLGERAEEELCAVLESVDARSRLVGFYSYGEIAPLVPGGRGVLHNQTMTLTRIWET